MKFWYSSIQCEKYEDVKILSTIGWRDDDISLVIDYMRAEHWFSAETRFFQPRGRRGRRTAPGLQIIKISF